MNARILGCVVENAIPTLCELLQKVLPVRPSHDAGFTEADINFFAVSVEANQQRLITNSHVPR